MIKYLGEPRIAPVSSELEKLVIMAIALTGLPDIIVYTFHYGLAQINDYVLYEKCVFQVRVQEPMLGDRLIIRKEHVSDGPEFTQEQIDQLWMRFLAYVMAYGLNHCRVETKKRNAPAKEKPWWHDIHIGD